MVSTDSDDQLYKTRRNLLTVSMLLIVYYLAGGDIKDGDFKFLGGNFTFSHPEYFILFVWLTLGYLIWRFWVFSQHLRVHIKEDYSNFLLHSGFVQYITPIAREYFRNRVGFNYTPTGPDLDLHVKQMKVSLSRVHFKRITVPNGKDHENVLIIPSMWKVIGYNILAIYRVIMESKAFSDFIAPTLVAIIAILIGLIK